MEEVQNLGTDTYNATTLFVDRHEKEGRGDKVAIYYEDQEITYREVREKVNQTGNALKELGIGLEDRVLLLLLDCPEFAYSFFGVMKIGAIPIPTNTMLKPADYQYILNDSGPKLSWSVKNCLVAFWKSAAICGFSGISLLLVSRQTTVFVSMTSSVGNQPN